MSNTILYQVYEMAEESQTEQFNHTTVMNSWELTRFLADEIEAGKIVKQNLEDAEVNEGDDLMDLPIDVVFQVLVSNGDYEGGTTYCVSQFEIEIMDNDMYD